MPLAEAHESGASEWPADRRHRYANDLKHDGALLAVDAGANRSNGARDPAEWMPEREAFHCSYLQRWVEAKEAWDLTVDPAARSATGWESVRDMGFRQAVRTGSPHDRAAR